MIEDSSKLIKGQILKVDLNKVKDRIPENIKTIIKNNPYGKLVGYKMVDGNQFGLALEIERGRVIWFFENELSEVSDQSSNKEKT